VEEFLAKYGDRIYSNGATAKLAIYCGAIERLEDEVYPLLIEMQIPPDDILKYHRGNQQHKAPDGAEGEWKTLDTGLSRKRIILLVQIGKEGWDCRSLTGVILSQKGDCPTNMVLQTSCRCLRQMDGAAPDGTPETAGIWLNVENAKVLDKQLAEEQHTSIEEINRLGKVGAPVLRPRTSRVDRLRLPPIDFYQMKVHYDTLIVEDAAPQAQIGALNASQFRLKAQLVTSGLKTSDVTLRRFLEEERGEWATFEGWLVNISKGSFGSVTLADLRTYESALRSIFDVITYDDGGVLRFNALYDEAAVASAIRLAFCTRRRLDTRSEIVPIEAHLLLVEKLHDIAADKKYLYPNEDDCKQMLEIDASSLTAEEFGRVQREKHQQAQELLKSQGFDITLPIPVEPTVPVRNKDRSFHYIPYNFDSSFELEFLKQALTFESVRERNLEVYFNGEGELTEFRIECFALASTGWNRVGMYSPDFLIVERRDGAIFRALIVETKGSGFAKDFQPRHDFVKDKWCKFNNDRFHYDRFDFLYLPEDMNEKRQFVLEQTIKGFFTE
ncbi:MAG: hypothetical protein M3Y56_10180, partial [Armatimonadota bacterium]|nr:hypothetical protein [Armatimonadota bacterium]